MFKGWGGVSVGGYPSQYGHGNRFHRLDTSVCGGEGGGGMLSNWSARALRVRRLSLARLFSAWMAPL